MIIELEPVDFYCPQCDSAMEWTACTAPGCTGYRCLNCDSGCDLDDRPQHGRCARILDGLPPCRAVEIRLEHRAWHMRTRPTHGFPGDCV